MNYIQRAIQWINRLIGLIENWQLQLRFKRDTARVQMLLGLGVIEGGDFQRGNKHYVKLELDFLNEWAGMIPDIDIAMTLDRPYEGIRRKLKRIGQDGMQ